MIGYEYDRGNINSAAVKREYDSIMENEKENSTKVKVVKESIKGNYALWDYLVKKIRTYNK